MTDTTNQKTRASGSGPSKAKTGPDDLVRVLRDEKIIELRRDGLTYVQIGLAIGIPKSTVADAIKRWMDERSPTREQVEELREIQGAQLYALHGDLWPHRMRALRNEDGEILYEGRDDERRPIQVPDIQVVDRIVKVMERRAKLYGLDLDRSDGQAMLPSAEMMAAMFGFDAAGYEALYGHPYSETIDVNADEIDEREALGHGSED